MLIIILMLIHLLLMNALIDYRTDCSQLSKINIIKDNNCSSQNLTNLK